MIYLVYFSPTHSTERYAKRAGRHLSTLLHQPCTEVDWTKVNGRQQSITLGPQDILVFAFPVYGGRVPRLCREALTRCTGNRTGAIILEVYGNRHYDDALLEAAHLLEKQHCIPIGAAAVLAEHTITPLLAPSRPTEEDLVEVESFITSLAQKWQEGRLSTPPIPGDFPYKPDMPSRPFHPETTNACIRCGLCVAACPMGIIDAISPNIVKDGCIQCRACMKCCPVQAKYLEVESMKTLQEFLESTCQGYKENEFYL